MSVLEVEQDGVELGHGGQLRGVVGHAAIADGALWGSIQFLSEFLRIFL